MARAGIEAGNLWDLIEAGNPGGPGPSLLLEAFLESFLAQITDGVIDGCAVCQLNKKLLDVSFQTANKTDQSHVLL